MKSGKKDLKMEAKTIEAMREETKKSIKDAKAKKKVKDVKEIIRSLRKDKKAMRELNKWLENERKNFK